MKVVLLKNISNIGKIGEVKEVANGYVQNYLLPNNFVKVATEGAVFIVKNKINAQINRQEKEKNKAQKLLKEIGNLKLKIKVKTNMEGKLFAALDKSIIIEEFKNKKIILTEKDIVFPFPIKVSGEHIIKINPAPGVVGELKIQVIGEVTE